MLHSPLGSRRTMTRLIGEGPSDEPRLRLNLLRSHEEEYERLQREVRELLPANRAVIGQDDKAAVRARHAEQRAVLLARVRPFLDEFEDVALGELASGAEVDPAAIDPEVTLAQTERDNRLFSYATLHWSVPVSGGYGRRSRFLVRDRQNGKLMGVFALSDPVYNLGARDRAIGWDDKRKRVGLYRVLDASVIGAMRPYADLLGGKAIALSSLSKQTLDLIERKYRGSETIIKKRSLEDTKPLLLTTTSALGRSSIYNRLRSGDRKWFVSLGWTEGYGHFEVPDALFRRLVLLLEEKGDEKARAHAYGKGPSWRMRTIRAALEYLQIEPNLALKHGIRREVFAAPAAKNWREVLLGEQSTPTWFDDDIGALGAFYRERWAVPRAGRVDGYRAFQPLSIRLRDRPTEQLTFEP